MKKYQHLLSVLFLAFFVSLISSGCAGTSETCLHHKGAKQAGLETVKAGRFDGGKMWTFDYPPVNYFRETYNFQPDEKWLEDVRMSSLKLSTGCSASFVSAEGLIMTNHHCVRSALVSVQKEAEQLLETGFYASTTEQERKIPDLFLEQLVELRDITADVLSAMEAAKTDEEKIAARQRTISEIEKKASEETKMRARVVTLYNGGKYSLYIYKRFADVRLVFVPELAIAHFGGEHDNFTYPRYSIDCAFLRVYDENGNPVKAEHFFKWSMAGAKEDELVFVVGNPGSTSRLNTFNQLEYYRDVQYPFIVRLMNDRAEVLQKYIEKRPEKKKEMITQVLGIANSQKAFIGRLTGLRDDILMQRRRDFDRQFRAAVEAKPELKSKYGHIWDEIAESRNTLRKIAPDQQGLRMSGLGASDMMSRAYAFARYAEEMSKPEEKRSEAYRGERLDRTRKALEKFSSIDGELELLTLTKQLEMMKQTLGSQDPIVQYALQGMGAEQAARRLLDQTILKDSVQYSALSSNLSSVSTSQDPFLVIARMARPRLEKVSNTVMEISARDQVNATLLGRAQFDVYGTLIPPDATSTLRIADGVVKGYEYNGTKAPANTTFYGMYDRYFSFPGEESWELPERWKNVPAGFNLSTPCNFSSTNDIIGGNSGSPIINKYKQVVGLVFDGNIESLPGDFIFAEDMGNRTVSVHSSGILEVLRHYFKASRLVEEIERSRTVR